MAIQGRGFPGLKIETWDIRHDAPTVLTYRTSFGASVMIDLGMLEDMFSGMRAKTNWNVDGPMLWGYFFTDRSAEKLEKAATHLTAQGYHLVGIHETDDGRSEEHTSELQSL